MLDRVGDKVSHHPHQGYRIAADPRVAGPISKIERLRSRFASKHPEHIVEYCADRECLQGGAGRTGAGVADAVTSRKDLQIVERGVHLARRRIIDALHYRHRGSQGRERLGDVVGH
jgi:hypothetical protein